MKCHSCNTIPQNEKYQLITRSLPNNIYATLNLLCNIREPTRLNINHHFHIIINTRNIILHHCSSRLNPDNPLVNFLHNITPSMFNNRRCYLFWLVVTALKPKCRPDMFKHINIQMYTIAGIINANFDRYR